MNNPIKSQIAANREMFEKEFQSGGGEYPLNNNQYYRASVLHDTSQTSLLQTAIAAVEGMKQKEPDTCACQPYKKVMCAWHASQPHINEALSKVVELLKGGIGE